MNRILIGERKKQLNENCLLSLAFALRGKQKVNTVAILSYCVATTIVLAQYCT